MQRQSVFPVRVLYFFPADLSPHTATDMEKWSQSGTKNKGNFRRDKCESGDIKSHSVKTRKIQFGLKLSTISHE